MNYYMFFLLSFSVYAAQPEFKDKDIIHITQSGFITRDGFKPFGKSHFTKQEMEQIRSQSTNKRNKPSLRSKLYKDGYKETRKILQKNYLVILWH